MAITASYNNKHNIASSEATPQEVLEVIELYEAVRLCELPPAIRKPVKKAGRKQYNRFLIIALIIYGLKQGWSYRQIEEFAKANWKWLKPYSFGIKKAPDHSVIYLTAKKLRVTDIFRFTAKLKELRGEIPVLWY